jgi:hypothetical protein
MAKASGSPVLVFMDGDFPQNIGGGAAANPRYAQEMAPLLKNFGHEIDREVAAHAPGTAVTYIGHSYGGAIVGSAEQAGLRADRVLHLSSAGTGALFQTGYNDPNPNVQRYSMTAPGDAIGIPQGTGPFGPLGQHPGGSDPDQLPGVIHLDTGHYSHDNGHHGELVFGPTDGHRKYLDDPGSTAFQNIAGVISGGPVTKYSGAGVPMPDPFPDIHIPDFPDLPRVPRLPDVPGLPKIPGTPRIPGLDIPTLPGW